MKIALILFFAILSEVIATTALKLSDGFTKIVPSVIVMIGYGTSFYLLEGDPNWTGVCDLVRGRDRADHSRGHPHLA